MREIQYRVWCVNRNEWETDNISLLPNGLLLHTSKNGLQKTISRQNHIVEFYIGRKDKNEQKVFENDIIVYKEKGELNLYFEVYWDNNVSGFGLKQGTNTATGFFVTESSIYEVTGNIHTNSKLMEKII